MGRAHGMYEIREMHIRFWYSHGKETTLKNAAQMAVE
jgi:hypothetical protein